MNSTGQGPTAAQEPLGRQEVVTQESLLLAAAERISKIREGRVALHLHLSELRPQNREDGHIRIAVRMLEQSIDTYRGQLFVLSNADVVLLCKDARVADLDAIVFKLRGLFSKDPLTYDESGNGVDRFCSWYEMEYDYDAFFTLCEKLVEDVRARRHKPPPPPMHPLDSKSLAVLQQRLENLDLRPVIRRQAAVGFVPNRNYAELVFQEFFVSMADLQRAVAPDVNLLSNHWMFQHFSQLLDQKILGAVMDLGHLDNWPHTYSLNLNLATLSSGLFRQFEEILSGRGYIIVEVQALDIFADINGFFAARDRLRARGHRLLLDGINAMTMQFMDLVQFGADLIKVSWGPELASPDYQAGLRAALEPVGLERVVLGRCDSEAAIRWGLDQGITQFQGHYIDAMMGAVTIASCDKAEALKCTLQQCINRKGVISGPLRRECGNHGQLDGFPRLAVPRHNR